MKGFVLALLLLMGCQKDVVVDKRDIAPTLLEAGPSLYALDAKLLDQDGAATSLDVWRGHPVLVGMFYASCTSACPLFVSSIKDIERALDERTRADLRVLLVSFDPKDTPSVLADLTRRHHVDETRWKLASASEDDARMIAAALGVKYKKLENGDFNHTSPLVLLGPDGAMHARVESVGDATDGLADRVRLLAR